MKRYQFVIEFDAEDDAAAKEEANGIDCWVSQTLDHCDPPPKKVTLYLQDKETGIQIKY